MYQTTTTDMRSALPFQAASYFSSSMQLAWTRIPVPPGAAGRQIGDEVGRGQATSAFRSATGSLALRTANPTEAGGPTDLGIQRLIVPARRLDLALAIDSTSQRCPFISSETDTFFIPLLSKLQTNPPSHIPISIQPSSDQNTTDLNMSAQIPIAVRPLTVTPPVRLIN